jgi:DEAD/DEAH box helicase domain-containing protein
MNLTVEQFISMANTKRAFGNFLVCERTLPARKPIFRECDRALSTPVLKVLKDFGIDKLYSHQALAINELRQGRNISVGTATASGKSLCYTLPIIERLSVNPHSRALLLFPTKALGHDQMNAFGKALSASGLRAMISDYDGDTLRERRRAIREKASAIFSNVDMLNSSILSQHTYWKGFLSNLEFVVIDESHYYRGVLGSHTAMLIRRLRRLLRFYGAEPQFILCSATLANNNDHAEGLVGLPFTTIDVDGSASGSKTFFLLNPYQKAEQDKSINNIAGILVAYLMTFGLRSLAFVNNRASAERVMQYAQQHLQESAAARSLRGKPAMMNLVDKVKSYRAGYLPEYRRQTEAELRDGELLTLVSTNAMELGVDIGALDSTMLVGYPGSTASFWQQVGRSGRNENQSFSLTLFKDTPVDQFFVRNPELLFGAPTETARISLENDNIVRDHLVCAARELPLSRTDFDLFGEETLKRNADALTREGKLHIRPDYTRVADPAERGAGYRLNMRSMGSRDAISLIDISTGEVLEHIEWTYALKELYPGAVYTHKGVFFKIVELDPAAKVARGTRSQMYEYTTRVGETIITPAAEGVRDELYLPNADAGVGDWRVSQRVVGFRTHPLYQGKSDQSQFFEVEGMPALEFDTKALWLGIADFAPNLPPHLAEHPESALHAVGHLLLNSLAMLAMCDTGDLAETMVVDYHPDLPSPSIFIFEQHEGGVGIVDYATEGCSELLERAYAILNSCNCRYGCPACVEFSLCFDSGDITPSKPGARMLLNALMTTPSGVRPIQGKPLARPRKPVAAGAR